MANGTLPVRSGALAADTGQLKRGTSVTTSPTASAGLEQLRSGMAAAQPLAAQAEPESVVAARNETARELDVDPDDPLTNLESQRIENSPDKRETVQRKSETNPDDLSDGEKLALIGIALATPLLGGLIGERVGVGAETGALAGGAGALSGISSELESRQKRQEAERQRQLKRDIAGKGKRTIRNARFKDGSIKAVSIDRQGNVFNRLTGEFIEEDVELLGVSRRKAVGARGRAGVAGGPGSVRTKTVQIILPDGTITTGIIDPKTIKQEIAGGKGILLFDGTRAPLGAKLLTSETRQDLTPTDFKKQIERNRKAFRSETRKIREALQAANEIDTIAELARTNPIAAGALFVKIARASGDVGVLSDFDIRRLGGSEAIQDKINRFLTKSTTAQKLLPEDIDFAISLAKAMQGNLETELKSRSDEAVTSFVEIFGGDETEIRTKITGVRPKGQKRAAPSGGLKSGETRTLKDGTIVGRDKNGKPFMREPKGK